MKQSKNRNTVFTRFNKVNDEIKLPLNGQFFLFKLKINDIKIKSAEQFSLLIFGNKIFCKIRNLGHKML